MERKIKCNGASWILSVALALYYHFFPKRNTRTQKKFGSCGRGPHQTSPKFATEKACRGRGLKQQGKKSEKGKWESNQLPCVCGFHGKTSHQNLNDGGEEPEDREWSQTQCTIWSCGKTSYQDTEDQQQSTRVCCDSTHATLCRATHIILAESTEQVTGNSFIHLFIDDANRKILSSDMVLVNQVSIIEQFKILVLSFFCKIVDKTSV